MGHLSINVSLTYLRGLEIAELKGRGYAYGLVSGSFILVQPLLIK